MFGGKSARSRDNTMAGLLDRSFAKATKADQALVASAGRLGDQPAAPDESETLVASAGDIIQVSEEAEGDISGATTALAGARASTKKAAALKLASIKPTSRKVLASKAAATGGRRPQALCGPGRRLHQQAAGEAGGAGCRQAGTGRARRQDDQGAADQGPQRDALPGVARPG